MVEISLSPHLHHIFTKPCVSLLRKSLAYEWSKYFSTDLRNILRRSLAYEWSKYLYHHIFTTSSPHLHQTLRKSLAYEWSKYFSTDLRNIFHYIFTTSSLQLSTHLHQTLRKLFLKLNERKHIEK